MARRSVSCFPNHPSGAVRRDYHNLPNDYANDTNSWPVGDRESDCGTHQPKARGPQLLTKTDWTGSSVMLLAKLFHSNNDEVLFKMSAANFLMLHRQTCLTYGETAAHKGQHCWEAEFTVIAT